MTDKRLQIYKNGKGSFVAEKSEQVSDTLVRFFFQRDEDGYRIPLNSMIISEKDLKAERFDNMLVAVKAVGDGGIDFRMADHRPVPNLRGVEVGEKFTIIGTFE